MASALPVVNGGEISEAPSKADAPEQPVAHTSRKRKSADSAVVGEGDENGGTEHHKIRKLKLYTAEEKLDIIDYAKVIGNRAAGREFNVAESSIREWRKNEDRLRRQIEAQPTGILQFESQQPAVIAEIDDQLVELVNGGKDVSWYAIRDKARTAWQEIVDREPNSYQETDMQITMGWITRFMRRNEARIPKISPPVIATATAVSGLNGSVTMVRKEPTFAGHLTAAGGKQKPSAAKPPATAVNGQSTPSTLPSVSTTAASSSRRKCLQPKRAVDATLLLTSKTTNTVPAAQSADDAKHQVPNPDGSENRCAEERETNSPVDGSEFIEVC